MTCLMTDTYNHNSGVNYSCKLWTTCIVLFAEILNDFQQMFERLCDTVSSMDLRILWYFSLIKEIELYINDETLKQVHDFCVF